MDIPDNSDTYLYLRNKLTRLLEECADLCNLLQWPHTNLPQFELANIITEHQKVKKFLADEMQHLSAYLHTYPAMTHDQDWNVAVGRMVELVKKVEKYGSRPNVAGTSMYALVCKKGDAESVRVMLRCGASPTGIIKALIEPWTPLYIAVVGNNLEVMKVLIENGANVDECHDLTTWPLFAAVKRQYFDEANYIVDCGAKLEKEHFRSQPLALACTYKTKEAKEFVVKLILKGANVNVTVQEDAKYGRRITVTPLLIAMLHDNKPAIHALVSLCGPTVLPPVAWTPHFPSIVPPQTLEIQLVLRHNPPYPAPPTRQLISVFATQTAWELYKIVKKIVRYKIVEIRWQNTVMYPGTQTLQDMGFTEKELISAYSAIPISPWILCGIKKLPPLTQCTSETLRIVPKIVRDSIKCLLLIAKREKWNFDKSVTNKIIEYICFGWMLKT